MRDYLAITGAYSFLLGIIVFVGIIIALCFPSYSRRCVTYLEQNAGVIVSAAGIVSSAGLIVLGLAVSTVTAEIWNLLDEQNRLEVDFAIPLLIVGFTVVMGAYIFVATIWLGTVSNTRMTARTLATTVIVMVMGLALMLTVDVYQLIKLIDIVVEATQ